MKVLFIPARNAQGEIDTTERPVRDVRNQLADLGVTLAEGIQDPDLIWISGRYRPQKIFRSLNKQGAPLLVSDMWRESCELVRGDPELLQQPNVLGLLRCMVFRDRNMFRLHHQVADHGYTYHGRLISLARVLKDPSPQALDLEDSALEKIETGVTHLQLLLGLGDETPGGWGHMDLNLPAHGGLKKLDFDENRPIDVSLMLTIGSADTLGRPSMTPPGSIQQVEWHRRQALKIVQAMGLNGTVVVSSGVWRRYHDESAFPPVTHEQWLGLLRRSKVSVSPWGTDARSNRDYEIPLSGAVMIKPDTSHVKVFPDVYASGQTHLVCRPDFSDLEQVIQGVLTNWEAHRELRESARNFIEPHFTDRSLLAQHLHGIFERCLARAQ